VGVGLANTLAEDAPKRIILMAVPGAAHEHRFFNIDVGIGSFELRCQGVLHRSGHQNRNMLDDPFGCP
jgi:hypothetical protein